MVVKQQRALCHVDIQQRNINTCRHVRLCHDITHVLPTCETVRRLYQVTVRYGTYLYASTVLCEKEVVHQDVSENCLLECQ